MARGLRIRATALVALLALAAGCRVDGAAPLKPAPSSSARPAAKATPRAESTSAAPAARATRAPVVALRKPDTPVFALRGRVALDANYMVAAGAGNVMSHNGGQIVAAGSLNLIGVDGAGLIGPDGAGMVAAGAGNIVAAGGLNMVPGSGGSLIGPDGAGLIGPDGAGVKAPAFRLAQGGPPAAAPPDAGADCPDRVLPAAVMRVGLVDLRTGELIPLGVTPDGKPVKAVYTRLDGGFEVYVPTTYSGYVRVVAESPTKDDQRLQYSVVAQAGDEVVVDDDTATTARFIRGCFVARMTQLMTLPPDELLTRLETGVSSSPGPVALPSTLDREATTFSDFVRPQLEAFAEVSRRRRFAEMRCARPSPHANCAKLERDLAEIAQRAADMLLSGARFQEASVEGHEPGYPGKENAIEAFIASMREVRARVVCIQQREKDLTAYFRKFPEFAEARRPDDGKPWEILRPSDVCDFIVTHFMLRAREDLPIGPNAERARSSEATSFMKRAGILPPKDEQGRVAAAAKAISLHLMQGFFNDAAAGPCDKRSETGEAIVNFIRTVPIEVPGSQVATPPPCEPTGTP